MKLAVLQVWSLYLIIYQVTIRLPIVRAADVFIESYCGRDIYGSPRTEDCKSLLNTFADIQDNGVHVFDEEELRTDGRGSWPGVPAQVVGQENVQKAVQIPRFLSLSKWTIIVLHRT